MHRKPLYAGVVAMGLLWCVLLPACAPPTSTPEPTAVQPAPPKSSPAEVSPTTPNEPSKTAAPGDALTLTHRLVPETYTPGQDLEVVVDMSYISNDPITALAIRQIVPEGWTFVAVTGGIQPAVTPRDNATGTLDFVWITTPDWPNNFSYMVHVPEDAQGAAMITGQGIYRTSGPELRTTPEKVNVAAGA